MNDLALDINVCAKKIIRSFVLNLFKTALDMPSANHPTTRQFVTTMLMCSALGCLVGHVVATQRFAHSIHYQEAFLGEPLLVDENFEAKLYAPHAIYRWNARYKGQGVDDLLTQAWIIITMSTVLGFVFGYIAWRVKISRMRTYDSHGSARMMTPEEVEATGMLSSPKERLEDKTWLKSLRGKDPEKATSSVLFGKDEKGKYFYHWGPEHLLSFAPTRSGKGVGMVVPSLLTWTESVLVTDIKGENFQITGWWRSLFSHVLYLNPTDPNSAKFNPLLELPRGRASIAEAMNLAEIIGERPAGEESPFWDGGAKKFLTAVILYVLFTQEDKSLGRCAYLLMYYEKTLIEMSECEIDDLHVQEYVRGIAASGLDKSENVRGGWAAGADGALDLWKDPVIVENTRASDFRLRDMQYAKRAMSLYLVIPPKDLKRLSPLIRLFFQQLTDELTKELNDQSDNEPHRLLMLCDEFPQFGRMEKIERAIAYTAGYGIRWWFITQGLDQLDKIYGKDNNFLSNCHVRLAYCCNDDRNAARLSKLLGEATGFKEQEGESGKKGLLASLTNRNVSKVEFARPLKTPGELQQLAADRVLVMAAGQYPIEGYKITYYDDPHFIPRFKGKRWDFPLEPLDDFPSDMLQFDWYDAPVDRRRVSSPERVVEELPPSIQALHDDALEGGEAPYVDPDVKLAQREMEHLDIPVEMSPREASIELTTRAFHHADFEAILEKSLRAGKLTQEQFDAIRAKMHPAPKEAAIDSTPAASSMPPDAGFDLENPFAHVGASTPLSEPPAIEPEPEAVDVLSELYADFGLSEPSSPESTDSDDDPLGEDTITIEDIDAHLEELRRVHSDT